MRDMLQDLEHSGGYALERYLLEMADRAQAEGNREQGCFAIARLYAMLDARAGISGDGTGLRTA